MVHMKLLWIFVNKLKEKFSNLQWTDRLTDSKALLTHTVAHRSSKMSSTEKLQTLETIVFFTKSNYEHPEELPKFSFWLWNWLHLSPKPYLCIKLRIKTLITAYLILCKIILLNLHELHVSWIWPPHIAADLLSRLDEFLVYLPTSK